MNRIYKSLLIMCVVPTLLVGCGSDDKKDEKVDNKTTSTSTTVSTTESSTTTTSTSSSTKSVKTTEKNEKKTTTESKKKTTTTEAWGKNIYISLKDGKKHKYTYTYKDEATCMKKGYEHYDIVYKYKPYAVFGCDKIKDKDGNISYGVLYYAQADYDSVFYY